MPGDGVGRRKSLKVFGPKRWLHSVSSSSGRFTIVSALNGHFLTQMPHPEQRGSMTRGIPSSNVMASILLLTFGQKR